MYVFVCVVCVVCVYMYEPYLLVHIYRTYICTSPLWSIYMYEPSLVVHMYLHVCTHSHIARKIERVSARAIVNCGAIPI
jgi:hypothetical protein